MRSCSLAVLRSCGLAVLRSCGLAVLQSFLPCALYPVLCASRLAAGGMRLAACGVLPMTLRLVSFFTIKIREFLKAESYYRSRKPHGKRLARLARPARSREAGLRRFTPQPARPVTAPCAPCPVPQFDLPISIELSSEQDC